MGNCSLYTGIIIKLANPYPPGNPSACSSNLFASPRPIRHGRAIRIPARTPVYTVRTGTYSGRYRSVRADWRGRV